MKYNKTLFQILYRCYEFCFDRWSYQIINEGFYNNRYKVMYTATNKFNKKTKVVTKYLN